MANVFRPQTGQGVGGNTLRSRGRSGCFGGTIRSNDVAGVPPAFFGEVGSWRPPFSVTQRISTLSASPLPKDKHALAVRRAIGFVQIPIKHLKPSVRVGHSLAVALPLTRKQECSVVGPQWNIWHLGHPPLPSPQRLGRRRARESAERGSKKGQAASVFWCSCGKRHC